MKDGRGCRSDEQGCQHECKWKADNNALFIADLRTVCFAITAFRICSEGSGKVQINQKHLCLSLQNINGENRNIPVSFCRILTG
jgi:hypothetical protein